MNMIAAWAAAFVFLLLGNAWAEALEGRVVRVTDGDTITVLDARKVQHRIRLAGIDAPEKKQAFGTRAKENLSYLVFGKTVRVDGRKKDQYGRLVGKVLVVPLDCPRGKWSGPKRGEVDSP